MIYLDNAATTQISPQVIDAMKPYLFDLYANPGTLYAFGSLAAKGVRRAREQVAELMHCNHTPDRILFTSGGSEANSLVFHGLKAQLIKQNMTHILISAVEHDSVRKAAFSLREEGFEVEEIPVTDKGFVEADTLRSMLRDNTGLVSVMYVNNETGVVNPVKEIGGICYTNGVWFHTDCVQAAGSNEINVEEIQCDFASVSAHKIHGMKGSGALYIRDKTVFKPMIHGGVAQEYGLRGGTENVPGIVAFGEACEQCARNYRSDISYIRSLTNRFYINLGKTLQSNGLIDILHCNSIVSPEEKQGGKILSLRFDGVDGESLLLMLDSLGVCVSAGSACRSREVEPSHVLTAMGLTADQARSTIRVSFSKLNTVDEVDKAASVVAYCANKLYHMAKG